MKKIIIIIVLFLLIIIVDINKPENLKIADNCVIRTYNGRSILTDANKKNLIDDDNYTIMHYKYNNDYLILHIYDESSDTIYYYVFDINNNKISDKINNYSEYEHEIENKTSYFTNWFYSDGHMVE